MNEPIGTRKLFDQIGRSISVTMGRSNVTLEVEHTHFELFLYSIDLIKQAKKCGMTIPESFMTLYQYKENEVLNKVLPFAIEKMRFTKYADDRYFINDYFFQSNKPYFASNFDTKFNNDIDITNFCEISDFGNNLNKEKVFFCGKGLQTIKLTFTYIYGLNTLLKELITFTFGNNNEWQDPITTYSIYFLLIYGIYKFHNFFKISEQQQLGKMLFFERNCLEFSSEYFDSSNKYIDNFEMENNSFSFSLQDTLFNQTIFLKEFKGATENSIELHLSINNDIQTISLGQKENGSTPGFVDTFISSNKEYEVFIKELFFETKNYKMIKP